MRKIITTTVALLTMLNITAFAQQKGTFTDARDKKKYKTVKIGEQTWMAENLNYLDKEDKVSKCDGDKAANCTKYGRLYDWETAKKACPAGWHLPNNAEWDALYRFADGTSGTESPYRSETAGKFLKAKSGWKDYLEDPCCHEPSCAPMCCDPSCKKKKITRSGNGTDKFGFSALPGGYYGRVGFNGYWWSSSEHNNISSYSREMNCEEIALSSFTGKDNLHSVRCLKD